MTWKCEKFREIKGEFFFNQFWFLFQYFRFRIQPEPEVLEEEQVIQKIQNSPASKFKK